MIGRACSFGSVFLLLDCSQVTSVEIYFRFRRRQIALRRPAALILLLLNKTQIMYLNVGNFRTVLKEYCVDRPKFVMGLLRIIWESIVYCTFLAFSCNWLASDSSWTSCDWLLLMSCLHCSSCNCCCSTRLRNSTFSWRNCDVSDASRSRTSVLIWEQLNWIQRHSPLKSPLWTMSFYDQKIWSNEHTWFPLFRTEEIPRLFQYLFNFINNWKLYQF